MQLVAITAEQFASKAWKHGTGYAFAAQDHILPVTAAELAPLVSSLPLGFVRAEKSFQLVAITSLQPGINLFVAPDGGWLEDYVPAALRAYPFRLVKPQDSEEGVLCIDESSGLVVDAGQGEAFFDDAGAPSQAVKEVLDFLSRIESSRVLTQAAVDALQAAELIQPWPLNLQQGEHLMPVEGLYRIDEAALNALSDDAFLTLRRTGALPLAYGQLLSMHQFAMLKKAAAVQARLREQAQTEIASSLRSSQRRSDGVADLGFRLAEGGTFKFS